MEYGKKHFFNGGGKVYVVAGEHFMAVSYDRSWYCFIDYWA